MTIQRTDSEVIITLPATVNLDSLQRVLNLLSYQETSFKSQISQEQVDKLASDVNKNWWGRNAERPIQ
ncbi:MAG: hypothetical protein LH606_00085 [Cytophagaceae bacterium]|nr:hypothetical protein [Cytophagaceae bacterium]